MKALKLKIFQTTAHYRIPFTIVRRHTYPIPPYSTVIGLICNVSGIKSQDDEKFKKLKNGLSLAIYGKYKSLDREYVWLRSLNRESHNKRFGYPENRYINQIPEHPGGQMPVIIDVLNDVEILIYIKHDDEVFLSEINSSFENPKKRVCPLHLGRAEDLVIFKEINIVEGLKKEPLYGRLKNYDFTWLIDPERGKKYLDDSLKDCEDYKKFFEKISGSSHLITSFYKIIDGIRVFDYIPVKLFEGGSFPMNFEEPFKFYFDGDIPLFFAKMIHSEV